MYIYIYVIYIHTCTHTRTTHQVQWVLLPDTGPTAEMLTLRAIAYTGSGLSRAPAGVPRP